MLLISLFGHFVVEGWIVIKASYKFSFIRVYDNLVSDPSNNKQINNLILFKESCDMICAVQMSIYNIHVKFNMFLKHCCPPQANFTPFLPHREGEDNDG